MTPIENTRRVYTDPRDTFTVTHLVLAAGLMALNHELLSVVHHEQRPRFIFPKSASADAERIRRHIDELSAYRDRAAQRGRPHHMTEADTHASADRRQQ